MAENRVYELKGLIWIYNHAFIKIIYRKYVYILILKSLEIG